MHFSIFKNVSFALDTSSTDKTSIFDSKSAIVEISYSKEPPAPVITPPPSLAQMTNVAIDMETT